MGACAQCGTVGKPTDKFCNVCGTPLARTGASNAPPPQPGPQYAPTPAQGPAADPGFAQTQAPPPQQGGFGVGSIARCQMGHEIAAGASYCVQGHPIALDQMQFSNEPSYGGGAPQGYVPPGAPAYGAPQGSGPGGYGGPQPQGGYGAPPAYAPPAPAYAPAASPYGAPPGQPYGQTPAPQGGYAPPPQQAYAPQGGYGAPPAAPAAVVHDTSRDAVPPKILRGFLVAYDANPSGDFWALTGGRLVVGRLGAVEGIDISMQAPTISSRHAAMVVDATSGAISVEDTGSTNGTFVNDEHIGFNGRRELRDGDRLRFGGYTTIVKVIGRL